MNQPNVSILYEDNHLLVLNKPAGLATMGAESGESLHAAAAEYLRTRYNKPGRAFLGIVSRLDAMTSGVIVMAKTSKAASRLTPQFAPPTNESASPTQKVKQVERASKIYLAVLEGCLAVGPSGAIGKTNDVIEVNDFVYKDDAAKRMRVCGPQKPNTQHATLRYTLLNSHRDATLIAVQLLTGRKHQIRVQFAAHGFPVWADRKYGGQRSLGIGIGLHSWHLALLHPTKYEKMIWQAPPPKSWQEFGRLIPSENELQAEISQAFSMPEIL